MSWTETRICTLDDGTYDVYSRHTDEEVPYLPLHLKDRSVKRVYILHPTVPLSRVSRCWYGRNRQDKRQQAHINPLSPEYTIFCVPLIIRKAREDDIVSIIMCTNS